MRRPIIVSLFTLFASSAFAAVITVPGAQPNIQAAVNASNPGDTILVSAGTYEENVDIAGGFDGLTIKAKGKVILDCRPSGATGTGPGFAVASQNVTIQGFTIRHAKGTNAHGVFAASGADGLTLRKLTIEHTDSAGIKVTANGVTIENTTVVGCDGGIQVTGANAVISKCAVRQDGNDGILITGNDALVSKCVLITIEDGEGIEVVGFDAIVEKNVVDGADGPAILTDGNNPTIRSNKILRQCDDDPGIDVSNASAGLVENNSIRNTYEDGIEINSSVTDLTVTKNKITNCGSEDENGIALRGSNCTVSKNVIRNSQMDGIEVVGDGNTISDNVIIDSLEDGIDVEVGANNNTIVGNKCLKNRGEGFENNGAGTTLTGNTLKNNRIDFADNGTFATPPSGNSFTTGGVGTTPEIDD
ncbi:MAG: right-handed parallel beta-helix repeat-containing protein [Planctomycetes bacterium]|nr:right-handed parallel beta-helix repeat-containing protein [Planctomycetota bacterium]